MPRTHLVITIGDDEHRVSAMDAPAQILQQVERCLVRPMHVFEYDQRLFALQLVEHGGEDLLAVRTGIDRRQQCALRLPRDVVQRGKRPGCEECIACPPKYPSPARLPAEFLYQCGFADARFTRDERNTAASRGGPVKPLRQIRKVSFALQQFHRMRTRRGLDNTTCNPSVRVLQRSAIGSLPWPARCSAAVLEPNIGKSFLQFRW